MKILSLTLIIVVGCLNGFSQSMVGTVEFQRNQLPAAVLELPYEPDVVSAALNESLSKKGKLKGTDLKGFTNYRNTQLSQNDSVNSDLYFKVERKSRKEKSTTIISLLLGMPKEAIAAENTVKYISMDQAKSYLNDLVPAIQAYNIEVQITDQTKAVSKAETKYKNLLDDADDLQKKESRFRKENRR